MKACVTPFQTNYSDPTPTVKKLIRAFVYPLFLSAMLAPHAPAELLTNGNFTSVSDSSGKGYTYGQFANSGSNSKVVLSVNNWATTGYNFVYTPNIADRGTTKGGPQTGVAAQAPGDYGNEFMWGKNNGSTGDFSTNPFAGNFLAADGGYHTGAITQSITTGLRTGQAYTLTFYWAVAQQESYTADNPGNDWQIKLGDQTFTTPQVDNPAKAFSGWMTYSNTFTYTGSDSSTSNPVVLSFLAQSGGSNPPFLLLGNVSLVPEPSSGTLLSLVGVGLTGGWLVRRRRRLNADAQA